MERPDDTCLNCGNANPGRYCSECGQSKRRARRPLWHLWHDLVGSHFSLEARLPASLLPLVFQPGTLTRRYLDGKRAAQLPPVRLYLVLSVILFALFSFEPPQSLEIYVGGELVSDPATDERVATQLDLFGPRSDPLFRPVFGDTLEERKEHLKQMNSEVLAYRFFHGLKSGIPTALILSIPLFALLLKLLYLGRGALYYDHFIFGLHALSFLFLILSLVSLFPTSWPLWCGALLVAALHTALALKRVYARSWPGTLVRFAVILASLPLVGGVIFVGVSIHVMWTL